MWKSDAFGFLSFPRFPRGVISTALLISLFSERSDVEVAFIAAGFFPLGLLFSLVGKSEASSQKSRARMAQERRSLSPSTAAALFAHRLTAHIDAMGVVYQPIENAVGQGRITKSAR